MAPKRAKTSGSSLASFDRRKFIDLESSDKFISSVAKRSVITERGLQPCSGDQRDIHLNIEQRGWEELVKQPEAAVVSVVREFYANMKEDDISVFVRGKMVPFDRTTINRLYHLPDIEHDEYSTYAREELDLEQVILKLCRPGTQWKFRGHEALSFKTSELSVTNKVWHSFICAKLLPVTHISDVTRERAILVYTIVTGKSIDVGRLVGQSIRHCRRASTTGGLAHPSLITALCRQAGVVWGPHEELLNPRSVMDKSFILGLKGWVPAEDAMAIEPLQACSNEQARASRPRAQESGSMEERLDRLERRLNHQHQEWRRFMSYQVEFNRSLVRMFAQCGFNQGANPIQFPKPPEFSNDPRHEEEGEDEEELDYWSHNI